VSKISQLVSAYRQHLTVPWDPGVAAVQRVIFAVYDKTDELRLRANIEEFKLATEEAGKEWLPFDLTDAFPQWMTTQEYRDAYFACPDDLDGYPTGELKLFVDSLSADLRDRIGQKAGESTVVALYGVGSLFGVAHVSTVVAGIQDVIQGRLLVFFPGEFRREDHTYRLLDARDGWNYHAFPLVAQE
jgi:hypothetical protein